MGHGLFTTNGEPETAEGTQSGLLRLTLIGDDATTSHARFDSFLVLHHGENISEDDIRS